MTLKPSSAVLVGFDAASLPRLEHLAAQDRLPNLSHLLRNGTRGRLLSEPRGPQAMIWPKWFEGGAAASWYFPRLWSPRRMRYEWRTAATGERAPFWEHLSREGLRVASIDVPQAPVRQPGPDGLLVQGWQVHDLFARASAPAGLWRDLARRFGPPPMAPERWGRQTAAMLASLRRQVLDATRQAGHMGAWLLRKHRPDLFIHILGGMHRAGHYLWDLGQIDTSRLSQDERRELEATLDDVYEASDEAFGLIAEAAPANARILAFALHGMDTNDGWVEFFPAIAERLAKDGDLPAGNPPLLRRIKNLAPTDLVQRATKMLPGDLGEHVVARMSARLNNWPSTPWFTLPSDLNGFVRINLEGREAAGVVDRGARYDELLNGLSHQFARLRDLEGRPIVGSVESTDHVLPAGHYARDGLPDLSVLWADLPVSQTIGVALEGRELVRWPLDQRLRSGRSGNHRPHGWFAAIGPGLRPHDTAATFEIADLVPTLYRWLGINPPDHLAGRPIAALLERDRVAA